MLSIITSLLKGLQRLTKSPWTFCFSSLSYYSNIVNSSSKRDLEHHWSWSCTIEVGLALRFWYSPINSFLKSFRNSIRSPSMQQKFPRPIGKRTFQENMVMSFLREEIEIESATLVFFSFLNILHSAFHHIFIVQTILPALGRTHDKSTSLSSLVRCNLRYMHIPNVYYCIYCFIYWFLVSFTVVIYIFT